MQEDKEAMPSMGWLQPGLGSLTAITPLHLRPSPRRQPPCLIILVLVLAVLLIPLILVIAAKTAGMLLLGWGADPGAAGDPATKASVQTDRWAHGTEGHHQGRASTAEVAQLVPQRSGGSGALRPGEARHVIQNGTEAGLQVAVSHGEARSSRHWQSLMLRRGQAALHHHHRSRGRNAESAGHAESSMPLQGGRLRRERHQRRERQQGAND